jgi:hypothetical protein
MTLRTSRATATAVTVLTVVAVMFGASCRRKLDEGILHKDDYQKAYIYAYPMIANYQRMYEYNIDKNSPQFKGPFNTLVNDSHVFTARETAVALPNTDTPISMVQADLRAEPIVFCIPDIQKERYYSVQLVDMYTFNYGYVGSRATGNAQGCYLISGPHWSGVTPSGILRVFQSDTQFSLLIYRTQLFGPNDLVNVKKIQAGYTVQPLSSYVHQPPPPAPPAVDFPKFTEEAFRGEFPRFLNFLLQFCPEVPEEAATRLQLMTIGIGPGKEFDASRLSDSQRTELAAAIKDGYAAIVERRDQIGRNVNGWRLAAPFGNRDFFSGDNLRRAAAAMFNIYGTDAEELVGPYTKSDIIGSPLDGSKNNYSLTFAADRFPPVIGFWSITMYDARTQLLVDNPINRYTVTSTMISGLKKNADGSLTIALQKDPPAGDRKVNWLPAPNGQFMLVLRLYWPRKVPRPSILPTAENTWDPPGPLTVH